MKRYGLFIVLRGRHVERLDWYVKTLYPPLITISVACILGVRNLTGLGSAPMPVLGTPDIVPA